MMIGKNSDSDNILEYIKAGTVGAEIGIWKGSSSEKFLARGVKKLYMVDPWSVEGYVAPMDAKDTTFNYKEYLKKYASITGGANPEDFDKFYESIYDSVVKKFSSNPAAKICRMNSQQWFETLEGELIDWIYVDGDHSYTGVMNDLLIAEKVLKPNGLFFGDDYKWDSIGDKGGVKKAVNEFVEERKYKLRRFGKNQYRIIM